MRKIDKITSTALIFTLIGVFLCAGIAYALRLPMTLWDSENKDRPHETAERKRLINLANDWENYRTHEEEILRLSCSLLGIDDISSFKPKRPIKPVILAYGRGTRAKATGINEPKALAKVSGKPSIFHVLDAISSMSIPIEKPLVLVGQEELEIMQNALKDYQVDYCIIDRPLGTGYSVLKTEEILSDFLGDILVIYSTQPVIQRETLFKSILIHQAIGNVSMTFPTAVKEKPYAPVLRDSEGRIIDSIEPRLEKRETPEYGEDNIGAYIVKIEDLFSTLELAYSAFIDKRENAPRELGFPNEMNRILAGQGKLTFGLAMADPREHQGIKIGSHRALTATFKTELVKEKIAELKERSRSKDEYLMNRKLVDIDLTKAIPCYDSKKVLITGAAGSIGFILSEYFTQFNLKELVLLDRDQENLISVENYLRTHYPFIKIVAIVADIRDRDKIGTIFNHHKPDFVFHAAANKYTDQLENEREQCEGLQTNVIGTKNLIESSQRVGVDSFVFFSSDKAVTPPTFYGVTKKVGELLMQVHRESNTKFITARPSNFLGSQGSIVPVLEEQIANEGVVRVQRQYRPKRYFVSMLEVAESIINIGALGESGEIYIVNYGEKIVINDLVDRLISLSGKKVKIEDMLLRPGDTLDIALLTEEENKIVNEKFGLLTLKPNEKPNRDELLKYIDLLEDFAWKGDLEKIKETLRIIVPEYKSQEEELFSLQSELKDKQRVESDAVNASI